MASRHEIVDGILSAGCSAVIELGPIEFDDHIDCMIRALRGRQNVCTFVHYDGARDLPAGWFALPYGGPETQPVTSSVMAQRLTKRGIHEIDGGVK